MAVAVLACLSVWLKANPSATPADLLPEVIFVVSVALAEILSDRLAQKGWQVSKRHREMERRDGKGPSDKGQDA